MTTSIKQLQGDLLGLVAAPLPITSSIDYILTNPCLSYAQVNFTASGKTFTLPKMDASDSLRAGQVIRIENVGSNTFDINLHGGSTLYTGLLPNNFIDFYLETVSSDGAFLYRTPVNGVTVQSLTAPYTVDPILDNEKIFMAQNTLTIPPISLEALASYPNGFFFTVKSPNSNTSADIYPTAPDTIDDQVFYHVGPYSSVTVVKNNVNGKWSTLSANSGGFDPGTGILSPASGGTGVNNSTHTLTIGANSTINQDVSTSGSPTFVTETLSGLTASQAVVTNGSKALASLAYTNANTASTLVQRDGSGNFSAGTITAALTGNATTATTATNATNTAITDDTTTNTTMYPTWVTANTGNLPQKVSSTKLSFNPSTATLTTAIFSGALSGNANTVTNGVYTTDTGTVTNTMLAGSIANAKLANSSVTINGTSVALGASGTVTASTTAALTISTGLQLNSGSTFDGSTAKTLTIDSTVATLSGTQTLTNKTQMNPVLISGSTAYTTGTASQSTTTVTGSGTTFTSDMVGGLIVFSGGQTAWVQGFISTTSLQCLPSQSVSSTSYTLYYNGVQMDSHGNIGLQTGNAKTYLTSPTFTDVTDKTKTATLSLTSQTTGTNSIIVTDTLTQTLTNKTLTSPTLSSTTTFANGATVRTGTTAADSYSLGAYGAGSGTYKAFVTFTNDGPIGAVPQCVIAAPSGGVLTIDGATIGSTTSANATVNTLTVKNGFISPPRIVTASGAITISSSDYAVVSNKTVGAATTVNLPAPGSAGQIYIIKDGKGDAGTNNITLTPASGNIDGASTFVMNINYQSITLLDNGTQYNIL